MARKLQITLMRSPRGRIPKHRKTLASLGLKRTYKTVIMPDNPCVRGMINQLHYLLKVEEVSDAN